MPIWRLKLRKNLLDNKDRFSINFYFEGEILTLILIMYLTSKKFNSES